VTEPRTTGVARQIASYVRT